MGMELKYKATDTIALIKAFIALSGDIDDNQFLANEMAKVTGYPLNIVEQFLTTCWLLNDKHMEKNPNGVIGYITLMLNLADNFSGLCDNKIVSCRYAIDIDWDIDEDMSANGECEVDLPNEVLIPQNIADEDISDYLSDRYEFCHNGFNLVSKPTHIEQSLESGNWHGYDAWVLFDDGSSMTILVGSYSIEDVLKVKEMADKEQSLDDYNIVYADVGEWKEQQGY